ncbi:MAG TPA: hypothetical protein VFF52_21235 [Isosphaeraceae bacterium]|nr:hypothetical protein [Isosphaeraceae bacterium]
MKTNREILVTLSDELFDRMRLQAQELHIPLKWLVAGLVCDTIDPAAESQANPTPQPARHVA